MINNIKKVDIFALPFIFQQGLNKTKNKTLIGGISSIILFTISLIYFGYLCFLYFNSKIQPSSTTIQKIENDPFQMEIEPDLIQIRYMVFNGTSMINLIDYEKQRGKKIISISAVHSTYSRNQSPQFKFIKVIECQNQDLQKSYCFDLNSINNDGKPFKLMLDSKNGFLDKLEFAITYCDKQRFHEELNCEDEDLVDQLILNLYSYLEVQINLKQYNTQNQTVQTKIKKEQLHFDNRSSLFNKYILRKSSTIINQGFIIQQSKEEQYFSDYQYFTQYQNRIELDKQFGFKLLASLSIQLTNDNDEFIIQFAPFTAILAQFSSVFNSLLILGFIARFFSEVDIFQEFIDIQLKVYFKKSAIDLLEKKNKNEIRQTDYHPFYLFNLIKKAQFKNKLSHFFDISYHTLQNIQNQIIKNIFTLIICQYVFVYQIRLKMLKRKSQKIKYSSSSSGENLLTQLIESTQKSINIFQIQKDLLQIKMILKLLLTRDQYAAVQLCGSKLPNTQLQFEVELEVPKKIIESSKEILLKSNQQKTEIENNLSINQNNKNNELIKVQTILKVEENINKSMYINTKSHLEILDQIDKDENLLKINVEQFLQRQQEHSEFDKRIMECMIGNNNI